MRWKSQPRTLFQVGLAVEQVLETQITHHHRLDSVATPVDVLPALRLVLVMQGRIEKRDNVHVDWILVVERCDLGKGGWFH